jgi:hypothetical protein
MTKRESRMKFTLRIVRGENKIWPDAWHQGCLTRDIAESTAERYRNLGFTVTILEDYQPLKKDDQ